MSRIIVWSETFQTTLVCKRLRLRVLTVCNWRIKISQKRHTFICHVKIRSVSNLREPN